MIRINRRDIVTCIVLSFLTFGLYAVYWEYLLIKNTKAIKNDPSGCAGEMFGLIFVPLYSIYWWYMRGKAVRDEFEKQGVAVSGNELAYLILRLFGLHLISMAIMQNDFNTLLLRGEDPFAEDPELAPHVDGEDGVCDFCGEHKPVTARVLKDINGTRYRNLCDDCYKNWKAQIDNKAVL